MKNQKYVMALLLCALIWGTAFVSQSTGGDAVGPFSFNAIRFLIGGGMLQCLLPILDRMGLSHAPGHEKEKKTLLLGGVLCGIMLCVGANFQQMGITLGTEVGRAGFLTSCYILLVPILGMFFHKKVPWNVWLGVVLCLVGLYLLCMPKGGFTMRLS
ncbi:MAG: DMT family transporter, partial [Lachnospiraceae bacterium]|nr:DMT family transporter [Lachnospiraceae bacterium]